MWYEDAVCGGRERAFSSCERSASRQSRWAKRPKILATAMRISSSRHLKNWKPTPVSDFARHPYMLMNLGQRDEPSPQGADPNSEIAKWFKSLRNSQGLPCCDISDCRRVDARMANGHYEARIDEQWATVPDETIKDIENPTGQYIACYRYLESSRDFPPNFYCFIPISMV